MSPPFFVFVLNLFSQSFSSSQLNIDFVPRVGLPAFLPTASWLLGHMIVCVRTWQLFLHQLSLLLYLPPLSTVINLLSDRLYPFNG